ncbi:MAG: hypothetical protein HFG92_18430 [Dorea sp.]|jgi:hypothetical protein|nr:hypothetical protein [Dorea sp.]
MEKIKCMFSNYYEIANDRGIGAEIYIDFENSCVDVTDCSVEREGVLLTPYKGELYPKRRALQDYLFEEGVDTSDYSNDWQYIYGTGRNYDFHEYYNQIIDSLMADWCAKNQIEIVFNA